MPVLFMAHLAKNNRKEYVSLILEVGSKNRKSVLEKEHTANIMDL